MPCFYFMGLCLFQNIRKFEIRNPPLTDSEAADFIFTEVSILSEPQILMSMLSDMFKYGL